MKPSKYIISVLLILVFTGYTLPVTESAYILKNKIDFQIDSLSKNPLDSLGKEEVRNLINQVDSTIKSKDSVGTNKE